MDIQIDRTAFENCFSVFTKVNIHTHTPRPGRSTPNYTPYRCLHQIGTHRDLRGSTTHQQRRETTVASSSHRMLSSNKNESTATTCKNTDKSPKHIEEKKPETKGYIMHDPINIRLTNRPKKALSYSVNNSRGVMLSVRA